MFKKSKKTFFKGSSKGKKAYPSMKVKQMKHLTHKGKPKQKKQMQVDKPDQFKTQPSGVQGQKMQTMVKKPTQFKTMSIDERIKRATS